jgi:hypothetical protein
LGISWGTEEDCKVHQGHRPRYLTSRRTQRRKRNKLYFELKALSQINLWKPTCCENNFV